MHLTFHGVLRKAEWSSRQTVRFYPLDCLAGGWEPIRLQPWVTWPITLQSNWPLWTKSPETIQQTKKHHVPLASAIILHTINQQTNVHKATEKKQTKPQKKHIKTHKNTRMLLQVSANIFDLKISIISCFTFDW